MKRVLIFIFCYTIAKCIVAQQTFFSTFTVNEWTFEEATSIVQTPDGFLLITRTFDQDGVHIAAGKFDTKGNLLVVHKRNNLFYSHYVNHKITRDSCYLIIGNVAEQGPPFKAFLAKMNQNGELVWLRTYEMAPYSTRGVSAHELENGDIILHLDRVVTMQAPYQSEKRLVRTDSEGNVLDYIDYPDPYRMSNWGRMELLSTGEWLMYFHAVPWTGGGDSRLAIRKLDANFNEIWTRSYFSTDPSLSRPLVRELPGNRYMIVSFQDTFIPLKGAYKIVQLITDSSGQAVQEELLYQDRVVVFCNNIQETPDGNFIGVGGALYPNPTGATFSWELPWVFKFNTNGEILWERYFYINDTAKYSGRPHPIFYFHDVFLLPDGRMAIGGQIQLDKNRPPDALLMVVDENGCFQPEAGCDDSLQPILLSNSAPSDEQASGVQVWPNPATDMFLCRNLSERPLLLRLHDALGRMVLEFGLKPREETRILTNHLSPGTYWLYAEAPGGYFFTTKIILQP